MSETKANITVVLPTYNRADLIIRSIASVQAQTYPVSEIIVVDDGSTDLTQSVVKRLATRASNIKYLKHERNLGGQAARNTGIRSARGEWIAFLDSDDEFMPDKLEKQLVLSVDKNYSVVHCECYCQRSQSAEPKLFGTPPFSGNIYKKLLCRPAPTFPGLLVKKECLQKIGFLDETIKSYQEWDTSIRLARHFDFGFINEPLFIYHWHDTDSISKDLKKEAEGYEQIVRKHAGEIIGVVGKFALGNHYKILAQKFCAIPDVKKAVRYISEYGRIEGLDTKKILQKRIELLFQAGKEFLKNRQYESALNVFDHIMYTPADNIDVQELRTICQKKIGRSKEIPRSTIKPAHLASDVSLF